MDNKNEGGGIKRRRERSDSVISNESMERQIKKQASNKERSDSSERVGSKNSDVKKGETYQKMYDGENINNTNENWSNNENRNNIQRDSPDCEGVDDSTPVIKKTKKPRKKRKNDLMMNPHSVGEGEKDNMVLMKKKRGKKKKEGKLSKLDKEREKKSLSSLGGGGDKEDVRQVPISRKMKKHRLDSSHQSSTSNNSGSNSSYTAAQNAVNDMMRRALEEDQYSALGSIVDTSTSDSEDDSSNVIFTTAPSNKIVAIKLDQKVLQSALRRKLRGNAVGSGSRMEDDYHPYRKSQTSFSTKKKKKGKNKNNNINSNYNTSNMPPVTTTTTTTTTNTNLSNTEEMNLTDNEMDIENLPDNDENNVNNDDKTEIEVDDSSIFDNPSGTPSSTWVECDKCKKWRRLRGVVDTKKLPSKWYCAMNKNDPEHAKCTAPEEDYDDPSTSTPESAIDHRARKHLRLWVRRLQCNEAYEARLPTNMTTRSGSSASVKKHQFPHQRHFFDKNTEHQQQPHYDWIRCCNPSCGKWRALLRFMDAKQHVLEPIYKQQQNAGKNYGFIGANSHNVHNAEWFCVMNTWDEKTASCAAPQEALPAIGCPPWVLKDEY